jgi:hypothetical protein
VEGCGLGLLAYHSVGLLKLSWGQEEGGMMKDKERYRENKGEGGNRRKRGGGNIKRTFMRSHSDS